MPRRDLRLISLRHCYRTVWATPEGKKVLEDLLRFSNVSRQVAVPNDPIATGFNDGMRRVGLRIGKFLTMSDLDVLRIAESQEEQDG